MTATQLILIQDVWEIINNLFLQTNPPSEDLVRQIEESCNEAINEGDEENENIYEYAIVDTDIDNTIVDWVATYPFKTEFLSQFSEETLRSHFEEFNMTYDSYEDLPLHDSYQDVTIEDKVFWCILKYIKTNRHVIRLR